MPTISSCLCHTRQDALEIKARLAARLAPRGLAFNEDKTRVVSLDEGFDFLGFNVRRYRGKLLIKPSKAAVRRIRARLHTELRSLRGSNDSRRDQTAQPDHPGMGQLLPDPGIDRDLRQSRPIPRGGSPTSGPPSATRTSRRPGSFTGTSASSTRPGKTGGCSATATAAPTCTASPGPASSDTSPQERSVTRRPGPRRLLGRAKTQSPSRRSTTPACGPQSPGRMLSDLQGPALRRTSSHKPQPTGSSGRRAPARRSRSSNR